ncbi:MAG: TonB-dependent receptor [Cellvibrio sp.]|uniref:TonB-dependent receptor n=1 Tax=Cellvibrio sp. TaxID=1965322 RepID=UPI0031AD87C2
MSHRNFSSQRVINFRLRPLALATAIAATLPGIAFAQTSNPNNSPVTDNTKLETVTVTATRRAESLQTVPVAVSVLKGDELAKTNRNSVATIAAVVPTLNFRTNASNKDASLFVRGVGTISTSPGVEPTVSTVIDGVVYARAGQATLDLFNIERIEVLRGPQGTLFGKNASAGVLNIVTKEPTADTTGFIDTSYFGGGDEKRISAGISGSLNDSARGSLAVLWGDYDGNVTNVFNGDKVNGYSKKGVRGKLVLTPTDDLKITLAADHLKSDDTIPVGVLYRNSTAAYPTGTVTPTNPAIVAGGSPVVASEENREINHNLKTHVEDENQGLSAQLDWSLGEHTLTSITAYRTWENTQIQDGDRLSAVIPNVQVQSHDRGDVDFNQLSQELRLSSPKGNFVEYVAGLYYLTTEDDQTYRRDIITVAGVPHTGVADFSVETTSYSAFGETTFNFTDRFRGLVGLRWTNDDIEFTHARVSTSTASQAGIRPAESGSGSTSEDEVSGRAGVQFDLTEDVLTYFTYSQGYKGPAYNVFFNAAAVNGDYLPLAPETSDSFELGLKSTLFDNRLRFNAAVFDTTYDNYQANFRDVVGGTVVTRLINAGEVSSKGVEVDFEAKITPQFTLSGAIAKIDARIDEFKIPSGLTPAQIAAASVNGKPLPFSPDVKGSLQANYAIELGNGLIIDLGTDYNWQSEVQYDLSQTPDTIQDSYGIWNASIALSDPDKGWRVALLGKNLADESYAAFLQQANGGLYRAVPRDDERYFGVNARWDF